MIHGARVAVDVKFLLRLMEFQGGKVHRVYTSDDTPEPTRFYILLEHPDLPEVQIGEAATLITVTMRTTCGKNGVITEIERMDPPKLSGNISP